MLSDRIPAQRRYQLWSDLCALADQLLDLTHLWWRIDSELADVHYDQCRIDDSQYDLPFADNKPGPHDAINLADRSHIK